MSASVHPATPLERRLAEVRGVVLDIDGCLVLATQPAGEDAKVLPGAVEAMCALRDMGLRTLVFTNASSRPPARIAASLAELGFPVSADDVMTPSVVAAAVLKERCGAKPVLAFGGSGVVDVLNEEGITVLDHREPGAARLAAAVLVGWDTGFDQQRLQVAAEALWAGAPLLVTSDAPAFATAGGHSAGVSGFIANGLTYVTGVPYEVLGKPSSLAVAAAARRLGVPSSRTLVAGDDLTLEVAMAIAADAVGVLVTTGTHSREDAANLPAGERPDLVVDGLGEVVDALRRARHDR
ncbi:HAD-IIA family hydrolase [Lentzea sp. NPDC058436]|uniref:HAD-IIA family hydrolase n=1 Tax=Lentzea sp. NPDC058436 TaxID=3346499 RepID=UPI0036652D0D